MPKWILTPNGVLKNTTLAQPQALKPNLCVCALALLFPGFVCAYAFESIPITLSNTMDKIIFDGKWTHEFEWKASSLNEYRYDDDTQIILRTAHQGDFVYVFLDSITDQHIDEAGDRATVCFDTKNNKATAADLDDYCFVASLDGQGLTYRGGQALDTTSQFQNIPNHEQFIARGGISDINDRYTPVPHPSYEFKIPTDLIGRQSVYGFHFLVYDEHTKNTYTYPQNLESEGLASNPDQWGEIYSPDKSLPEFGLPTVSLVISFMALVFFSRVRHNYVNK